MGDIKKIRQSLFSNNAVTGGVAFAGPIKKMEPPDGPKNNWNDAQPKGLFCSMFLGHVSITRSSLRDARGHFKFSKNDPAVRAIVHRVVKKLPTVGTDRKQFLWSSCPQMPTQSSIDDNLRVH